MLYSSHQKGKILKNFIRCLLVWLKRLCLSLFFFAQTGAFFQHRCFITRTNGNHCQKQKCRRRRGPINNRLSMMGGAVRRVFCVVLAGGRQRHQFLWKADEKLDKRQNKKGEKKKAVIPARSGIYEAPSQTQ